MEGWLGKLLSAFELKTRILVVVAGVSGLLLLLDDQRLTFFGLVALVQSNRAWISLAFFLSSSFVLFDICAFAYRFGNHKVKAINEKKRRERRLHGLTPDEKTLLGSYMRNNSRSRQLRRADGVPNGLLREQILFIPHDSRDGNGFVYYNIEDWAWEYLKTHSELISGVEHQE